MKKARELAQQWIPQEPEVLDVGGRNNSERERSYVNVWPDARGYSVADIEPGRNVDLLMPSPYEIPITDDTFDVVISGQTLEHVANPFRLVSEMRRVLMPGGVMILIAPAAVGYAHGDWDCWRLQRDAFKAIGDECEMETIADWIYTGDSGGDRGRLWDDHTWVGRKP